MLNFGKTFGVATTAPAFTSFCVNELVAAQIYESNASSESGVCLGVSCYQGSFLIITLTLILTLTLLSRLLSHHGGYRFHLGTRIHLSPLGIIRYIRVLVQMPMS